ncbi:hypothetical protein NDU88_002765 [Pleurodeles waltl]|uniref:Uncharacterized protein n=1 Tax=Pleurodeles waltl TaxID=8319 RepID=A0AAV7T3F7_PLEWA|nr:hypothetical protein NDU88_002765 [Pleurodeles waltl]
MSSATSRIRRHCSRRRHNEGVQRAASVRRSAALVLLMQLIVLGVPCTCQCRPRRPPPGRAAPRSRLLGCPGAAPAHRHPQDHPASCCLRRDPRRPGAALSRAPLPVRTPGPSLSAPSGAPRQAHPTGPSAGRAVPVPHRHLQTFYRSWQLRLALK